jgi:hypothetical protein
MNDDYLIIMLYGRHVSLFQVSFDSCHNLAFTIFNIS